MTTTDHHILAIPPLMNTRPSDLSSQQILRIQTAIDATTSIDDWYSLAPPTGAHKGQDVFRRLLEALGMNSTEARKISKSKAGEIIMGICLIPPAGLTGGRNHIAGLIPKGFKPSQKPQTITEPKHVSTITEQTKTEKETTNMTTNNSNPVNAAIQALQDALANNQAGLSDQDRQSLQQAVTASSQAKQTATNSEYKAKSAFEIAQAASQKADDVNKLIESIKGGTGPVTIKQIASAKSRADSPILSAIADYYIAGENSHANPVLLESPPSMGKGYVVDLLKSDYDTFHIHCGCGDAGESDRMIGMLSMTGQGTTTTDGPIVAAVRSASEGKNALLFIDELFRISGQAQQRLLDFMAGTKVDGELHYRITTRHDDGKGAFEVLTCKAKHLHIIAAANPGRDFAGVKEAFYDRFDPFHFSWEIDSITAIITAVLSSKGIEPDLDRTRKLAEFMGKTRELLSEGSIAAPASMRMFEGAAHQCAMKGKTTVADVILFLAANDGRAVVHKCAHKSTETGDLIADSRLVVMNAMRNTL